ncbi:hypothetical protein IE53DRAFT_324819 [Violaceomyces palustris]|uniref:Uncharacterized protein n=1 Tax=Violaceomyces palustris TaxID=1673888 RepID=A0ACD0P5V2_9BASI|nr:hypothetical protein IE53DRAFT_324819 [Violaceomyces palustris]
MSSLATSSKDQVLFDLEDDDQQVNPSLPLASVSHPSQGDDRRPNLQSSSRPPSYKSSYSSSPPLPTTNSANLLHRTSNPRISPFSLRSTVSSKEAEFEADSDELDQADGQAVGQDEEEGEDQDLIVHSRSDLIGGGGGRPRSDRSDSSSNPNYNHLPLLDRLPGNLRASVDGLTNDLRHLSENLPVVGVPGWDGQGVPDWLKRGAGVFDGTVNMANSILGAGIVGLPYSMRESGFFAGLVLLVGLSFLTDWTIRLIVLNAKLSGRLTYIEIMEHCFGHKGKAAVSIFQFAFAFGGMCAFCVSTGDTIPHVVVSIFPSLAGSLLSNRQVIITFCTLTISYPLSLYRNIESLSKASAIALLSMVVIILAVIVRGPATPDELKGDSSLRLTVVNFSNLVRSISVISFAFVCHHNSLLIYGSLKEPSMNKFGKVTHYSTFIAAVATISMSVAGYWTFEDKTLSNILNNFPETDTMVNVARGLFGLNMLTTLPLECFVCREVLEHYFFAGVFDRPRHLAMTTGLVVSAMVVSLLTCDLGIVLELTGGLSATALAFIFPSLCYLKLSGESGQRFVQGGFSVGGDDFGRQGGSGGQEEEEEEGGVVDDGRIHAGAGDGRIRHDQYQERDAEEVEEGRQSSGRGGLVGEEDVQELEVPLRPGAELRFRKPASQRKWYQSTRPLSVACAMFGTIVLVVSVWTALGDFLSGRAGAVHQC